MLSRNHIKIIKEQKPSWLKLKSSEVFIGQGKFYQEIGSEPSNHWIIKSVDVDDSRKSVYYAIYNNSKVRLDKSHIENAIKLINDADDTGVEVFDYSLPKSRPLPLPLINVLATTDNPSVYVPVKINLFVDLNDSGEVVNLEWGSFTVNLPRSADRTSNVMPTLAWDNTDYAIPSNKKQHLAWRDLLINGVIPNIKSKSKNEPLSSKLDLNDPPIKALVKFLKSGQAVDLSGKPKSLTKARICYRYRKTGKLIPHCNSIRAMAKELLGDMDELITQSPLLALHGNTVRLFNTPTIENISYGIAPKMQRGVVLSAFDEFMKHRYCMIKVGDIGIMLYRQDGEHTPLNAMFEALLLSTENKTSIINFNNFIEFEPSSKNKYKLIALDLTSKGSVRCPLALKINECDFYEYLKRSLNLTTTVSTKKPISFIGLSKISDHTVTPYVKGRTLHNIQFITGMSDTIGHQFVFDVKTALNKSNDYEFYMRKHFLKVVGSW